MLRAGVALKLVLGVPSVDLGLENFEIFGGDDRLEIKSACDCEREDGKTSFKRCEYCQPHHKLEIRPRFFQINQFMITKYFDHKKRDAAPRFDDHKGWHISGSYMIRFVKKQE